MTCQKGHLGAVRELLLQSLGFWADCIIPFAVEVMPDDVDGCEFVVGDVNASGVHRGIEFAADFEAGLRRRRSDQLDDHLMTDERLAAPVAGDEREQAVLDLVSLARARRQVTHGDRNAEFVSEFL